MNNEAVTGVQRHIRRTRACRVVMLAAAALNAFMLAVDVAAGSLAALLAAAAVIACLVMIVVQTRLIRTMRRRELDLSRPRMTAEDYRRLRELERELGWEPSEVPESLASGRVVALEPREPAACDCNEPRVVQVRVPESATPVASYCAECGRKWKRHESKAARPEVLTAEAKVSYGGTAALSGSGSLTARPRQATCDCGKCDDAAREFEEQLREQVIASHGTPPARMAAADTTTAATAGQYARWLRGYVKSGGKVARWYDYPFARAGFRYAAKPVTVDSDCEYGTWGRSIIIARNVPTKRTRPAAAFGGWAHTRCYWMHGYRTSDPRTVAAYSDPEFDEFRREHDAPGTVAAEHFAALARVDRERCTGFCPICAERDHR